MKSRDGRRRAAARSTIGAAAFGGAVVLLLVLPLASLGSGQDPVGDTVGGLLNAVPMVTHVVQSVVTPPPAANPAPAPAPAAPASAPPASSGPSPGTGGPGASPGASHAPTQSAGRDASGSMNTPAMYGTNPHGQGTVAGVAVSPSTNVPYPYDPKGSGGEIAVLGRGRSEQTVGGYHAHTTILDLLGQEILATARSTRSTRVSPPRATARWPQ